MSACWANSALTLGAVHSPKAVAFIVQPPRSRTTTIVRASREEELAALRGLKSGLGEKLEQTAAEAAPPPDEPDGLPELWGRDFWTVLNALPKDKLACILCYTAGCGACRAAKPKLALWSKDLGDSVAFYKFGLTLPNKERALEIGVKTAPTFVLVKNGTILEIIRGGNNTHLVKNHIYANKSIL